MRKDIKVHINRSAADSPVVRSSGSSNLVVLDDKGQNQPVKHINEKRSSLKE